MAKIIRVMTTVTVDIDADKYAKTYGLNAERALEIRESVKEAVHEAVTTRLAKFLDQHGKVEA